MSDMSLSSADAGNPAVDILMIEDDPVDTSTAESDIENDNEQMRSKVWVFFKKISGKPNNFDQVKCNLCNQMLKFNQKNGSTSNMRKHLSTQHEETAEVKQSGIFPMVKKRKLESNSGDMRRYVRTLVTPAMDRELALYILKITCEMNLSFRALSTSVHFQEMLSKLVPGYTVPSRTRLRSLLEIHYTDLMNKLTGYLKNIDSIALTTDATVLSGQGLPYVVITGHFIDQHWKLRNVIMGVVLSDQHQDYIFLSQAITDTLDTYQLGSKIQCMVTDEGSNFLKSMKALRESEVIKESMRCVCHRMHIAVKHGIKKCPILSTLLVRCQTIVKKYRNSFSSNKKDILYQCQIKYLSSLVDQLKSSSNPILQAHYDRLNQDLQTEQFKIEKKKADRKTWEALWGKGEQKRDSDDDSESESDEESESMAEDEEALEASILDSAASVIGDDDTEAKQHQPLSSNSGKKDKTALVKLIDNMRNRRSLMLNVITRWNSSIAMVKRVVAWQPAINDALWRTETTAAYDSLKISDADLVLLTQFIDVTESIYDATIHLQADSLPTLSTSFFWYFAVFEGLRASSGNVTYDIHIRQFCTAMANKLSDKFQWDKEKVMILATMLDPRFKNLMVLNRSPDTQDRLWAYFRHQCMAFTTESTSPSSSRQSSAVASSNGKQSSMQKALKNAGFQVSTSSSEIDQYKALPSVPDSDSVLDWWRDHGAMFPVLSKMARRYLAIPASSAASERAWSAFGDIYTKKRNRLHPQTLCKLLLIKHNQDTVSSFLSQ